MPSTMTSCFPKIKRPQSHDSQLLEDQDPQFPVFIRNFNSLYSTTSTAPPCQSLYQPVSPEFRYGSSAYNPSTTLDLSAVYASQRFFISSPGQSNSIVDSSTSSSSRESHGSVMENSVAIATYSPDPYADFRRSMEEMVEARETENEESIKRTSNWEYLHELLLCYLALNPKATHKFIIGAFADLVVDHLPATATPAADHPGRGCYGKASIDANSCMFK
ncbi:hypothetical protein QQ045_003585 [Rhodiola kirilowii]